MIDIIDIPALDTDGLRHFHELRSAAVDAVTEHLYAAHGEVYAQFGQRGREACREDLGFHLEFLRPVLEFGLVQPMVDYLHWLSGVLAARDIPADHLPLSLDSLAEFFLARMDGREGDTVAAALRRTKERFLAPASAVEARGEKMPAAWPESAVFEAALLAGDQLGARSLIDGFLDAGHSLVDVELHVVQPALYEIGRKWQCNRVTVVQEHLATAISQATMTHGLLRSSPAAPLGLTIVLACVAGNNHSVGLQMVADSFQLAGWDIQYLGANVPTQALVQHVVQCKPDLLGLSVSLAHQLRAVKDAVRRLTDACGADRPSVIVGGLAVNQFSSLAGIIGADTWSPDALAAVGRASELAVRSKAR